MRSAQDKAAQMQWSDAQDIITGTSEIIQSVGFGLGLAAECSHPDARWLTSLFPQGCESDGDFVRVLREHPEDARALCLLAEVSPGDPESQTWLEKAARLGSSRA